MKQDEYSPAGLAFTEIELAGARRANRLLSWAPRFRPGGRLKTAFMQGLLHFMQLWPSRLAKALGVQVKTWQVRFEGRDFELRILFPPNRARGIYFDVHGGAWIVGNAKVDDTTNALIAAECGMIVVSVEYRLAGDGRLDLAIADCSNALGWLLCNCVDMFDLDRIIVGGESAGAHLASCALLESRNRKKVPGKVEGAVLLYGLYDMSGSPSLRAAGRDTLVLHGPSSFDNLLRLSPDRNEDERRRPDISPLYGELNGLPPAILVVGTLDPLIDDTLRLAEQWQAANRNAELVVVPEAPHAFNRLGTAMANKTNAYIRGWIDRRLNAHLAK